jgi:hypothetical protein
MKRFVAVIAFGIGFAAVGSIHAYEALAIRDGGVIAGRVTLQGNAPAPKKVLIAKDNDVCGHGHAEHPTVSIGQDGALAGVVVHLEQIETGKAWPANARYELDQQKCAFTPALQVMPRGAELTIRNSDPVLHNIHPFEIIGSNRRTLFNLAQPTEGQINVMKIEPRRGRAIELTCDSHNWMSGWIYVVDSPYYAVAGADGGFEIGDVPPGEYKLVAWHPTLGTSEQAVKVAAKSKADVAIAFKAPQ